MSDGTLEHAAARGERAFAGSRRQQRRMRDEVVIGQTWMRRRDKRCFEVVQVHRADREAELRDGDHGKVVVSFNDMRRKWRRVESSA